MVGVLVDCRHYQSGKTCIRHLLSFDLMFNGSDLNRSKSCHCVRGLILMVVFDDDAVPFFSADLPLVAMEYMAYGDLRAFLRSKGDGVALMKRSYVNSDDPSPNLDSSDLFLFALDIANGLEHLSVNKVKEINQTNQVRHWMGIESQSGYRSNVSL